MRKFIAAMALIAGIGGGLGVAAQPHDTSQNAMYISHMFDHDR